MNFLKNYTMIVSKEILSSLMSALKSVGNVFCIYYRILQKITVYYRNDRDTLFKSFFGFIVDLI